MWRDICVCVCVSVCVCVCICARVCAHLRVCSLHAVQVVNSELVLLHALCLMPKFPSSC
ncbi:hypothetical protein I79_005327 [Cricetulus griseus]|uniref:Secreted protein n=1 Tax=Cricetulus griseus TaxID=10029 RepID=G3H4W4_CRIGR|nr:hypothetical protein I79_005327 [Cricetulus griseus]